MTLDQTGSGGDGTQAIVHELPIEDVESTLKVSAPSKGDKAIALGLYQDVRLTWTLDRALTTPAPSTGSRWRRTTTATRGWCWVSTRTPATRSRCPLWTADDPKSKPTVQVTIDVKH